MVVSSELDRLELTRRLSGIKFTTLAERTQISYKRLWRFFREDGPLTRQEMVRVEAVLNSEDATQDAELLPSRQGAEGVEDAGGGAHVGTPGALGATA